MNREILFRGKRTEDGKWMYGYYQDEKTSTADFPCIVPFCGSAYDDDNDWEVDVETVGQYTGLTDKNGTKIFEGDIIHGFGGNFAVRWSPEICSFVAGEGRRILPAMTYGTMKSFEVIGNIYDNPELMEDKENE